MSFLPLEKALYIFKHDVVLFPDIKESWEILHCIYCKINNIYLYIHAMHF